MRPNARRLQRVISRKDETEDAEFCVIWHDDDDHDSTRPLVIVVHPGDMIETEVGVAFSRKNREGTAAELRGWRDLGYDIVFLHRGSCSQFGPGSPWYSEALAKEIRKDWQRGSVLYGDDLDSAGEWMVTTLDVSSRPHIHLAGAYSDPVHGCLTHIGRMMEAVTGPNKVSVSEWSPPGSGPGPVWTPGRS